MAGIQLDPLDTLFFRSGTPFSKDSAPQSGVESLFPPHPMSVVGVLRAALALCNGWNGHGKWSEEINAVLGDGPENLGTLSIDGPFLLRVCDGQPQPLFPMPRHLLGSTENKKWIPKVFLRPGPEVECDLGSFCPERPIFCSLTLPIEPPNASMGE